MNPITVKRVAMWTATVVLVLLGFEFLWLIKNVIFLIFLSILLATGIEPLVNLLRRGPFNKGTGILLVYTVIFGIIALFLYLTLPPIISEGQNLVSGFSNPQNVKAAINNTNNDFLKGILSSAYDSAGGALQNLAPASEKALTVGLSFFESLFSAVTVFVIAFYWLTERPIIKRLVFSFISEHRRPRGRILWDSVELKLGAWVRGQLILMAFIGVLDAIGYTLLGIKFALALAVFAAIAELVPLVGPYLGGAPAVLIALTQPDGGQKALFVLLFIIVVQLVEGNILVPRIMESAVGVTPLTVIIGILIGSTLMGIGGALLAVPIAAALQVIFNNIISFTSDESNNEAVVSAGNTGKAIKANAETREENSRSERVTS